MLAVVFGVGSGSTALKEVDLTSLAEDVQRLATMVNQRAWHGMVGRPPAKTFLISNKREESSFPCCVRSRWVM